MKKYILSLILAVSACFVFGDSKEELKKIVTNVDTKEFADASKNIDKLQEQGEQYVSQGKYEKALESYKKSLAEADKLFGKNSSAAASSYTAMAIPYIKMGKKIKAAETLIKASEVFKKSAGVIFRPRAGRLLLLRAGFLYSDSGSYQKAWEILKKAEKEVKNFSPKEKKEYLAKFYRYLALALFRDEKYKEAIPYLRKSLSLENQKKTVDAKELAVIYLFLGEAFLEINELDKSLLHLKPAEKYFAKHSNGIFFKYRLYLSLSTVCMNLKKYEQSLIYSKKLNDVCKLFKKSNFRRVIGLITLADAYHLLKQKRDAVKLMKKAIKIAKLQNVSPRNLKRLNATLNEMRTK